MKLDWVIFYQSFHFLTCNVLQAVVAAVGEEEVVLAAEEEVPLDHTAV